MASHRVAERGAWDRKGSEAKEERGTGAALGAQGTPVWALAPPDVSTGAQGEKVEGPRRCREVGTVSQQVPGKGSWQNDAPEEKEEEERH